MNATTTSLGSLPARVRARWRWNALAAGLSTSLLAMGAGASALLVADMLFGIAPAVRSLLRWLPLALALVPLPAIWRRARSVRDARDAALLVEEREPGLDHLFVTALEVDASTPLGAALRRRADQRLARVRVERAVPYTFGRLVPWSVGALLVAAGLVVAWPGGPGAAWARWARPAAAPSAGARAGVAAGAAATGGALEAGAVAPALTALRITVTPPGYTGLPPREASPDALLSAFPGSRIEIDVTATAGTLGARRAGGPPLEVVGAGAGDGRAEGGGRAGAGQTEDGMPAEGGRAAWTVSWLLAPDDRGVDITLLGEEAGAGEEGPAPGGAQEESGGAQEESGGAQEESRGAQEESRGAQEESVARVADRRVIPVAVLEDRAPEVVLELPAEDMVVATASGVVPVRARATDDFGVGSWELHWIHSSGSGESFSFREGRLAWDEVGARADTLVGALALDLAAMDLGPGDVLHLRAEARDGNDVTGPGVGVSATRLLRVAEPDALDEVTTLIGFPIEREREPVLSQRMIILLTEELLEEAAGTPGLDEETFRDRSNRIADEQDRLRERVEEAIFVREAVAEEDPEAQPVVPPEPDPDAPPVLEVPGHDHDGNPIMAVNQDLMAAFNAMWEASRFLRQAEPRASLPPQHEALARLQAVREGERVFARGRVTRPPLDLDAARGTGEVDEAAPVPRSVGEPAPDGARWRGEIEAAAEALEVSLAEGPGVADDPAALALRLQDLAAAILAAPDGSVSAAAAVERAARRVAARAWDDARNMLGEAAAALTPATEAGAAAPPAAPAGALGAEYLARLARGTASESRAAGAGPTGPAAADEPGAAAAEPRDPAAAEPRDPPAPDEPLGSAAPERPFVFATARYASGDWDSAPLVPSNLVHSLAQYTDLPVEDEGVVVDLSSPELLRYPFVFLTGHLPVRLDERESEGLRRYVERGGFIFIDDHNHDIDGGFHRSVVSELTRIFGPGALQPLPQDHELYQSFFVFEDGPPITGHELSGWGDGLIHRELFAVTVDGRIGVLYSNKDYASEWSYHAENKRFLARDNTRFGVNVILYALTR